MSAPHQLVSSRLALAWPWLLAGALAYAGLFGLYSWPLGREFGTAFVGLTHGDANQYVWNAYNFQRQVAAGANPFHTSLLLFPEGVGLWLHTYTPALGLLNVLLRQEILAVNVGLLASFVLSGVGAARLAGRWLQHPLLCLLVGFVFAFSPYKLAHWPEHYHLLLTATVPFYITAFLNGLDFAEGRLPRVRRWGPVVGCAALLLITLLSDYYTLAGLVYFSVGYAGWFWLRLGAVNWRRRKPWLVLLAVVVGGHLASRLLDLAGVPDNAGFWWGGDLAGYLVPPLGNRWLASPATNALWHSNHFNMPGTVENVTFLGYALPLLALGLALVRRSRTEWPAASSPPAEARPLWVLALLFFLLTLPMVKILGHNIIRPVTGLVHFVPFLNNIRCPTRYVLLLTLLLPLATFIRLEQWWTGRPLSWQTSMAGLLGLLLGLEFQVQAFPMVRNADVPAAYLAATALPGPALYPIPMGLLDGYHQVGIADPAELFYQTRHHKALPGGYISRISAATFADFEHADPVQYALLRAQTPDSAQPARPTTAEVRAFLQRYQPAAFVIHPEFRKAPVHQLLRQLLQPLGYTEEPVGRYVLVRPKALPAAQR